MLPFIKIIWIWLVIGSTLLIFIGGISANQNRTLIPPDFDEICKIDSSPIGMNPVRINCKLTDSDNQTWRLDTLREWINASEISQSDRFSYNISCGPTGGKLSAPWPMKCPRLVELIVTNCNITDIYSEIGNPLISQSIPSQLITLEIIDSSFFTKTSELLHMFREIKVITSEYHCLHDKTVEKITFRNVGYFLEGDMQEQMQLCALKIMKSELGELELPDLPDLPEKPDTEFPLLGMTRPNITDDVCDIIMDLPKRMKDLSYSCNYTRLRILDDSVSRTLSVYHHRFLTKYSKFPVLEFLNYSSNYIDEIPPELCDWSFYFTVMKSMDLSHNYIKSIRCIKSTFVNKLTNDTYINVQHNNITTLTPQDLDHLKDQPKTFIDIRNNPLMCDCDLRNFIVAIFDTNTFTGSLKKYQYILDMTCHGPSVLKGRDLKSLKIDDLKCHLYVDSWIAPVTIAVTSVLLITLIILSFIYRREIRILFYTRLHIQIPGTVYIDLGSKTFHAFVSYSNEDEDWVLDVLCKQLETPNHSQEASKTSYKRKSEILKQFKLCLHGRDFVPGMTIIENIITSIEKSRHTVIVLTENFVESKWAMEEFYQAYRQSVMERRRHLIIVILGEIPEEKMDPVLKRCLKTFTYLKASDKLFFDRLAYSLSTESRMSKEESSSEEKNLKSRKNTVSVDIPQENDSGIFIVSDDSTSIPSGQLSTHNPVNSTRNGVARQIEVVRL